MNSIDGRNRIRLDENDLDSDVYRIYSLRRLELLFFSQTDALVSPEKWDDPFENFFLQRTEVHDAESGTNIPLNNLAKDWYGQCWSLNPETDAMWRIYSPDPVKCPGCKSSYHNSSSLR